MKTRGISTRARGRIRPARTTEASARPVFERNLAGALHRGAIGQRIGKGNADLDQCRPRPLTIARISSFEASSVRIADRQKRHERRPVFSRALFEGRGDARRWCSRRAHRATFNAFATVSMSLSPRPERLIRMISFCAANARFFHAVRDRVARFECRNDSFRAAKRLEAFQRFGIGDGDVAGAAGIVQPGVLGTDAGIVEAGRDRMAFRSPGRLRPGGPSEREPCRTPSRPATSVAACRPLSMPDRRPRRRSVRRPVGDEGIEDADGIGSAADAGDDRVRETAGLLDDLGAGFAADHRLQIAHHIG